MRHLIFLVVFFMCCYTHSLLACTDFRLMTKDGTVLIARSMEFSVDLQSNVRSSNRGRQFTSMTPNNKPGLTWKAKYGYLFVDGFNQDYALDGMNEAGLSVEGLYLPGETQYQDVPQGKDRQAVSYLHFGDWVLSHFKSIDEVQQALHQIIVFKELLPGMGNMVFPLHFAIFDASGKGLVVEFVNGKMNVFNNVGMMTNSPTYDWQVTNLRNFLNLSPYTPKPITADGITFSATGQGSGAIGLPGDVSPPSRFSKIAFLLTVSYPVNDAASGLNLAEHIINNVDIPSGLARAVANGKETSELTQWVVFKDLTNKLFYYRTYNNMTLRRIALNQIDFSENAPRFKMPLAQEPIMIEMTNKFKEAKN